MASKTINNLDSVSNITTDDLLVIGQGSLGKKATIAEFFAITPGTGSTDTPPNIPFITYDREISLTDDQLKIARSNLGIKEDGTPITSGVSSINKMTGDVTLYLSNFTVSQTNTKYIDGYINEFITDHNDDKTAHSSLLADYASADYVINKIDEHNNSTTAHATEIGDTITNRLVGYATESFVTNKLDTYAEKTDLPTNLSQLTDDIHYISYDSQSGYTDSQKTTARININAIGSITSDIIGQTPLTGDSVKLTAAFIGAVPTTTSINGKLLSSESITLNAGDVGAVPTDRTINGQSLSTNITLTALNVNALALAGGTLTGDLNMGSSQSATNKIVLNTAMYGSSLPSTGVAGQFFFLYA